MTLDEKLDYIGGTDGFYVRANPRLHLPALRMADGPLGVRNVGPSTAYAGGIALAASFDTDLAARVGAMLGRDARARGVHFLLGPAVNIYRAPLCGRNFEYFGEDPFLASRIAVAYINGVQQQGVSATVKHFIANNSEFDRHHTNAEIDERTMHEIYLPAFEAAVKEAHVGAIMSAYNLVNGVHLTQHELLNNQLVKKDWAFDGIIMSDWDATYDGVAAANAGLDIEMPSGKFMNRATLLPAIQQGKVALTTIDDKVRRILRKAIQFGWLDRDQTDLGWPLYPHEGRALALESARASLVLLKNQGDLLPLDRAKIKSVAVIGPNGFPALPAGGGSAQVRPFAPVSFLEGLVNELGPTARVTFSRGVATLAEIFDSTTFTTSPNDGKPGLVGEYFNDQTLTGHPLLTRTDEHINFAWDRPVVWPTGAAPKSSARWTGFFIPPADGDYRFVGFSYGLDEYRLYLDGKLIFERAAQAQPIAVKSVTLEEGRAYAVRFDYVHGDHHARVGLGVRRADQPAGSRGQDPGRRRGCRHRAGGLRSDDRERRLRSDLPASAGPGRADRGRARRQQEHHRRCHLGRRRRHDQVARSGAGDDPDLVPGTGRRHSPGGADHRRVQPVGQVAGDVRAPLGGQRHLPQLLPARARPRRRSPTAKGSSSAIATSTRPGASRCFRSATACRTRSSSWARWRSAPIRSTPAATARSPSPST